MTDNWKSVEVRTTREKVDEGSFEPEGVDV